MLPCWHISHTEPLPAPGPYFLPWDMTETRGSTRSKPRGPQLGSGARGLSISGTPPCAHGCLFSLPPTPRSAPLTPRQCSSQQQSWLFRHYSSVTPKGPALPCPSWELQGGDGVSLKEQGQAGCEPAPAPATTWAGPRGPVPSCLQWMPSWSRRTHRLSMAYLKCLSSLGDPIPSCFPGDSSQALLRPEVPLPAWIQAQGPLRPRKPVPYLPPQHFCGPSARRARAASSGSLTPCVPPKRLLEGPF